METTVIYRFSRKLGRWIKEEWKVTPESLKTKIRARVRKAPAVYPKFA